MAELQRCGGEPEEQHAGYFEPHLGMNGAVCLVMEGVAMCGQQTPTRH